LDSGIVEVVEEKEDPSPCTIHIHNIVISNKNKDLGVMNVEVHCMSKNTYNYIGKKKNYALGGWNYNTYLKLQIETTKFQQTNKRNSQHEQENKDK
jgi:hypothetical protein